MADKNITLRDVFKDRLLPVTTSDQVIVTGTSPEINLTTKLEKVATLGDDGKLLPEQVPAIAISNTFVVDSQEEMLALKVEVGDIAIRTDLTKSFILKSEPASVLANWQELLTPGQVISVNGKTGVVELNKADIGLGNVDNTSDLEKPVSNAVKEELAKKQDLLSVTAPIILENNTIGVNTAADSLGVVKRGSKITVDADGSLNVVTDSLDLADINSKYILDSVTGDSTNLVSEKGIKTALDTKQDIVKSALPITIDADGVTIGVNKGSDTLGVVKNGDKVSIQEDGSLTIVQNTLDLTDINSKYILDSVTGESTNLVNEKGIKTALDTKQDTLSVQLPLNLQDNTLSVFTASNDLGVVKQGEKVTVSTDGTLGIGTGTLDLTDINSKYILDSVTGDSTNLVNEKGIKTALDTKQNVLSVQENSALLLQGDTLSLNMASELEETNSSIDNACISPSNIASINNFRKLNTSYSIGDTVSCAYQTGIILECTQSGTTSDLVLDTHKVTVDSDITDGSVIWKVKRVMGDLTFEYLGSDTIITL